MKNALPKPNSDTAETLLALIKNRSLTSIELRKITKSSYPPARIKNCIDAGVSIYATREKYVNRRGEVTSICRYHLGSPIKEPIKIYKKIAA
jgi:hypothetical protein